MAYHGVLTLLALEHLRTIPIHKEPAGCKQYPSQMLSAMYAPPQTLETVISSLGAFAVGKTRTERDLLCLMILFHTHGVTFKSSILPERPDVLRLAALTQRHVAEIAAEIWRSKRKRKQRDSDERENYVYWYEIFSKRCSAALSEAA
jgi:hypothetical protein